MSIIATTDFSADDREAACAAAAVARRLGEPLLLVHAVAEAGAPDAVRALQDRLSEEISGLGETGARIEPLVVQGDPAAEILACVERIQPWMVIAAAVGSDGRRHLGSVAAALAHGSSRPLLIVRSAAPFLDWTSGKRALRIVVGDDFSAFTEPAFGWIRQLQSIGPIELTVAHLYSPLTEHGRVGLLGGAAELKGVEERIAEDLQARVLSLGEAGARVRIAASYGRVADPLVALAAEEHADVLVLGTHQRGPLERAWYGSVSRLCLELAPMAVASVPFDELRDAATLAIPPVRRVLACTDFSRMGDSAVAYACAILPAGGEIVLLHVIPVWPALPAGGPDGDAAALVSTGERQAALRRLETLIPRDAAGRGITFRTEIAAGARAASLICRVAAREHSDVICLASHGRSGIRRTLLGSVASGVIAQSTRPVLIVRTRMA